MDYEAIIHVVEKQHKDGFLLENIPFGLKRPEDIYHFYSKIGNLQEIAKMYGKSPEEVDDLEVLKAIAEQLFDVFEDIGEIQKCIGDFYRLRKEGRLYKHLADKLVRTP